MTKDWTGSSVSNFKTMGARNHTDRESPEHDYYATHPKAIIPLIEGGYFTKKIWECACGDGHLSTPLKEVGLEVRESDIVQRSVPCEIINFRLADEPWDGDILTNPPYKFAEAFIRKALSLVPDGNKVFMFLPIRYLEGKARKLMFDEYPPKEVLVFSYRVPCAMNGDFDSMKGSAASYAWFIWEKGFTGDPIIKWL